MTRAWTTFALAALLLGPAACGNAGEEGAGEAEAEEARIDEDLGTLTVLNRATEPVAIHLDGQELYAVPSGRTYTFHNLPVREVDIYGVGRVSRRHYDLPRLTIEAGGEYEWTINP